MTTNSGTDKKSSGKAGDTSNIGQAFEQRMSEMQDLPDPQNDKSWEILPQLEQKKASKSIFSIFGKKSISEKDLSNLRQEALQSPGNTRIKINKLKQQFPKNPAILTLSALCLYGMLQNSSNQEEVVSGLKGATLEAAQGLMNDGLSLFNLEYFFKIYFAYLEKLRRKQMKVLEQAAHNPDLEKFRRKLQGLIKRGDQMFADKQKTLKVIDQLKKKLKSANYMTIFDFVSMKTAGNAIAQNQEADKATFCSNKEFIAYLYAMVIVCARTPMLSPLVDMVLDLFPSGSKMMHLRKISIRSVRDFSQFKLAMADHDIEKCRKITSRLAAENWTCVQKFEGQPIQQVYESDPHFNLAFISQLAMAVNPVESQKILLTNALNAMNILMRSDMSKNNVFSQSAENHAHKLAALKQAIEKGS